MFRMTADIKFEGMKPTKCNSLTWKRSIDNYIDSSVIKLPAIAFLKKAGVKYEKVETGLSLFEGQPITAACGYDDRNVTQFKGFISRINFSIPVEIECEGYAYQLRKKLGITKHYYNTTVKQILTDITEGTNIVLSNSIPDIPIPKAIFRNNSGIQVLEWLKQQCLLTVYFNFETLYVGLQELEPKTTVKVRLGWNTVKDDQLKFIKNRELADVRIKLVKRMKDGIKRTSFYGPKDGQVVEKRISGIDDEATLAKIAEQVKQQLVNKGYEGSITTFLRPYIEPGMAIQITDAKYPDRSGKYFVTGVAGSFSSSGGRVNVKIGRSLGG